MAVFIARAGASGANDAALGDEEAVQAMWQTSARVYARWLADDSSITQAADRHAVSN